jgi:hypothetical protein
VNDLPISGLRPRSKTSATWQLEADFAIGTTAIAVLVLEVRKLSVESQMMQFSHTQLQIFWAIKTVAHGVTNRFQVPEKQLC